MELPKCRHGQTLSRGIPQGVVRCFGCDEPCEQRLECCQCLEIFEYATTSRSGTIETETETETATQAMSIRITEGI